MDCDKDYCMDALCADYLATDLNAMLTSGPAETRHNPTRQKKLLAAKYPPDMSKDSTLSCFFFCDLPSH